MAPDPSFPAVFLDRDGTINLDHDYVYRIEDCDFIPGSIEGIRLLNESGFKVIVVTNQSGIGRGFYTVDEMNRLHEFIQESCSRAGAHIDAFLFCPHHPDAKLDAYRQTCECRKPSPGLIKRAGTLFPLDMSRSWVIGDSAADMGLAKAARLRSILVRTGKGQSVKTDEFQIDFIAENLYAAVTWLLGQKS